jgi:transcriptional regulator with GAF, ATPase, and Fis domain
MTPGVIASVVLRLGAAAWPALLYRRVGDARLLALSAVGGALLIEALIAPKADPLSLGISGLALVLVAVAGSVFTTRLETVRRLQASERLNRVALENVSDAVFITDDDGVLTHAWPSVGRFFGLRDVGLAPGTRVEELLGPIGLDTARLETDGAVTKLAVDLDLGRGGPRRLLVDVKRVSLDEGTRLYTVHDVTEIAGMESALARTLEELRSLKDRFEAEALYLKDELRSDHNVEGIIGSSPQLRRMLGAIETVAETESTVLIRGETGSGKELVARALHELSGRRERPLVKVNCAALPADLVESELFGHEKGAFTGAVARKLGRFELADGGTLFLDEIGELPLALQPKLLRVLQEGEFERVGGTETIRVDVRLLAATNRNLKAEADAGRFRSDLYFRLEVFPIDVPPLRDRKEDLLLLASHFLADVSSSLGREFEGFTQSSLGAMERYAWPGNIRELRNVVERAAIVAPGDRVDLVPFLPGDDAAPPTDSPLQRLVDVEREHVLRVLDETDWTIEGPDGAAEILGLHPSTLRSRMKRLGIRRTSTRT